MSGMVLYEPLKAPLSTLDIRSIYRKPRTPNPLTSTAPYTISSIIPSSLRPIPSAFSKTVHDLLSTSHIRPDPVVLNLLLALIYTEVHRYGTANLPGIPYSREQVLTHINEIPPFATRTEVARVLANPRWQAQRLLIWICEHHGKDIELAQGDSINPGFARDGILQFVVRRPRNGKRHADFLDAVERYRGRSTALLHGTSLSCVSSILSQEFKPSSNARFGAGAYMTELPRIAYHFATMRGGETMIPASQSRYRVVQNVILPNFIGPNPEYLLTENSLVTAIAIKSRGSSTHFLVQVPGAGMRGWLEQRYLAREEPAEEQITCGTDMLTNGRNPEPSTWQHSLFPQMGVILGCQVAGKGREVNDQSSNITFERGGVHVITYLSSIAVRYIFVLPHTSYRQYRIPHREEVAGPMMEAFRMFDSDDDWIAQTGLDRWGDLISA